MTKPKSLKIQVNNLGIQCSTCYSPTYRHVLSTSWIQTPRPVQVFDSEHRDYSGQKFRTLVHKIRDHLTAPESHTREQYETVVQHIADIQPLIGPGCAVGPYFRNCFPSIQLMSWKECLDKEPLAWGLVKQDAGLNQIQLSESLVIQYEKESDLEKESLSALIILSVIMHELSHALTQHTFEAPTPYSETVNLGADPGNDNCDRQDWLGESGFVIEQLLFGFRLLVEWKHADRGKMDKIHRLIARGEDGGTRVIRSEDAKSVVDSLTGIKLYVVSFHHLEPAPEEGPPIYAVNTKPDGFIRIEVPSGKCFGSTRNPQPFAAVAMGSRFRASVSTPEQLAANIIREPVTGGNRFLNTEEKGIVQAHVL